MRRRIIVPKMKPIPLMCGKRQMWKTDNNDTIYYKNKSKLN